MKKRLLVLLLSLSMVLGMVSPTAAFAAESDIALDGISSESNMVEPASTRTTSFGPGDHYWGGVTFTGDNGGLYKTINGDRLQVKMAFKPADNEYGSVNVSLSLVEYPGTQIFYRTYYMYQDEPDADGYYYFESEWMDITYGADYRFFYSANSDCECYYPRRATVHIWIEVE